LLAAVPKLGSMQGTDKPARFPLLTTAGSDASAAAASAPLRAPATGEPLLKVRGLKTTFPVRSGLLGRVRRLVHAVEQVSFDLAAGETLALVGESGSGKSTTGRSLLRLVDIEGGSIEFGGRDIARLPPGQVRLLL
jgi:glutathione transport system ATP-binding protein